MNGNGGGGSGNGGADSALTDTSTGHPVLVADDPITATNAANRDYAQPVYAALDGPVRARSPTASQAAATDGLVELDASHALTTSYATANNGNVVQTARIAGSGKDGTGASLALGFGSTQAGQSAPPSRSLGRRFDAALDALQGAAGRRTTPALNHRRTALPGIAAAARRRVRATRTTSARTC